MTNVQIAKITIYQLAIPFRKPFGHGSAVRHASDNVVVCIELGNGLVGYGETLAREYVTGETPASVVESIQRIYLPLLLELRPDSFGEVMDFLEALPIDDNGQNLQAARCAIELAILDVYGKQFGRDPTALSGWIDQSFWEQPGATENTRYSAVVGFKDPRKLTKLLLATRLWRLTDIKVKVGDELEFERLSAVVNYFARAIRSGKVRVRVDANEAWSRGEIVEKVDTLEKLGVLYLEQPTMTSDEDTWAMVQQDSDVNVIADESLVSFADAERLADDHRAAVFNIRIAKNGGLLPSLKLAAFAHSRGLQVQLGCLVGETAILTRAGQWFASILPDLIFAEGNYGTLLMKDDISTRREAFRFGGRISVPSGPGLGVTIDRNRLKRCLSSQPIAIHI